MERGEIWGKVERWRWRGCGLSDKEKLHCRIMTAIHFVLLCVAFNVFFLFSIMLWSQSALYSQQQGDAHWGQLFPLVFIRKANNANRPLLEGLKGKWRDVLFVCGHKVNWEGQGSTSSFWVIGLAMRTHTPNSKPVDYLLQHTVAILGESSGIAAHFFSSAAFTCPHKYKSWGHWKSLWSLPGQK